MASPTLPATPTPDDYRFLWLELTGRCQLKCRHCYANSGPQGTHGSMELTDWLTVIAQAPRNGVKRVQFIGGEPTLHPHFHALTLQALNAGLEVEVYSNLAHVSDKTWEVLSHPGVRLATSFYSDDPAQHALITGGRATFHHTVRNIQRALAAGIPLRAGMVRVLENQRLEQGRELLACLGVQKIGADSMRVLGRPAGDSVPDVKQLCGNCGRRSAAVLPDGSVTPCPLARWMRSSVDVREAGLSAALEAMRPHRELIAATVRPITMCGPDNDGECHPCEPSCTPGCDPGVSSGDNDDDGKGGKGTG
ncbi:radical SAM/SPASM domain-containing protein [Nonomuraea fuscirosea]|uniref:radical SAM/SPASM domain-containing protein n=1 Tax=Nonomuraea fuscirosea TaxID=1291556 RepID=UPI00371F5EFF